LAGSQIFEAITVRLSWADQAPVNITFGPEEVVLSGLESLAKSAGYKVVDSTKLDFDARSLADMAVETDRGMLFFGVRQKSHNGVAKIDIETRPKLSHRTRHLLLMQRNGDNWQVRNDSDLPEGALPQSPEEFRELVTKLFGDW
jgi:hypothetical protein